MIENPGPCPQNPLVGLIFHVENRAYILAEKEIGGVELPQCLDRSVSFRVGPQRAWRIPRE